MASTRSTNQTVKLTKRVVDRLTAPATGQAFYRDAELKGFAVRLTASGVTSFIVEKRIDGKVRRITLGRYGELTVEQARKEAQKLLGQVAMGMNPIADKQREQLRALTLEQVYTEFKRVRAQLKTGTLYQYSQLLKGAFADWKTRPIASITKDMIARKHAQLGAKSEASANLAMRFLRSLFNFALAHYEDETGLGVLTENPVQRLTRTRSWYRTRRKQSVIKGHQLPSWYKAVTELRDDPDPTPVSITVTDYLLLLLYSGLRRQEAAQLTWDSVDLEDRTLLIPDPKNHVPHVLPLSKPMLDIFKRRKTEVELAAQRARQAQKELSAQEQRRLRASAVFVFPGEGPAGYLIEPKRQIAKIIESSKVQFSPHDLRRTFITIAESLDVPPYAIKRLVNHTVRNDVTAGYIISDIERLREPMERIANFIQQAVRENPRAKVHQLRIVGAKS